MVLISLRTLTSSHWYVVFWVPKSDGADACFSQNLYEWCGNNNYMTSGYELLQNQTEGFPVPIFVSETGCNVPEPRTFEDQAAIFGPMSGTWSGSIIYEWIQVCKRRSCTFVQ